MPTDTTDHHNSDHHNSDLLDAVLAALADGDHDLADAIAKGGSAAPKIFSEPGPPPRPGLVWKEETHRWVHPETGEEHPHEPAPEPANTAPPAANTNEGPGADLHATATALVAKSNLPPEKATEYAGHMARALHKLPAGARAKALESVGKGSATFHPDLKAVRSRYATDGGSKSGAAGLLGYVKQPKGSDATHLNLDGGSPDSTDPQHTAEGVYLHELGHAADPDSIHSSDPKWAAVWKKEIKSGRHGLTRYALTDESEGFAELVRVVAQKGAEANRAKFPKCVAYLESKGLL